MTSEFYRRWCVQCRAAQAQRAGRCLESVCTAPVTADSVPPAGRYWSCDAARSICTVLGIRSTHTESSTAEHLYGLYRCTWHLLNTHREHDNGSLVSCTMAQLSWAHTGGSLNY